MKITAVPFLLFFPHSVHLEAPFFHGGSQGIGIGAPEEVLQERQGRRTTGTGGKLADPVRLCRKGPGFFFLLGCHMMQEKGTGKEEKGQEGEGPRIFPIIQYGS